MRAYLPAVVLFLWAGCSLPSRPLPAPVWEHELPEEQWRAWNSLKEEWRRHHLPACLENLGLKLSCADCPSIIIEVRLDIDREGKLSGYSVLQERVCGGAAPLGLVPSFLEYFQKLVYPPPLRGQSILARLGNGLKC